MSDKCAASLETSGYGKAATASLAAILSAALALALLVFLAGGLGVREAVADEGGDSDIVPVYKLYDPKTEDRLFTADEAEAKSLLEDGWHDEGIAFYAHNDTDEAGYAIYRVHNKNASTASYHYTSSKEERDGLVSLGWTDDGIAWFVDEADSVEVFRVYNPRSGEHYYTASPDELGNLVAASWTNEGIGWWAAAAGTSTHGPLDKLLIKSVALADAKAAVVYDGAAKEPAVEVLAEGSTIIPSNGYDVSYSNNTGAGTATVKVIGKAPYSGSAETTFVIEPASIEGAKVEVAKQRYTGEALTPDVKVTLGGKELVSGTDFEAAYSDNVNVGTAKVAVAGKGNYAGTASGSFRIEPDVNSQQGASQQVDSNASGQSMHRLYNRWSGEHFYTADDDEAAGLVALGWNDEGEGWKAPEKSDTPVFRLYNPYAGEHHYTVDASEKDAMVVAGWLYEDIGWYSDDGKAVPLYREYNPNEPANNHNYTTDAAEHAMLLSLGWRDEGYAWYGV